MKYICLGYIEPNKFETMPEKERNTMVDECFTYDDELRQNGHGLDPAPWLSMELRKAKRT